MLSMVLSDAIAKKNKNSLVFILLFDMISKWQAEKETELNYHRRNNPSVFFFPERDARDTDTACRVRLNL